MKKKLLTGGIIGILTITGVSAAAFQSQASGAENVPPIVQQVADHEDRIDTLENEQATTEQTVEQHGTAIQTLKQETRSTSAPSAPSAPAQISAATATAPEPSTPAPEAPQTPAPVVDPRTITAVRETTEGSQKGCWYSLYDQIANSRQGVTMQPPDRACRPVGDVLPEWE